MVLVAQLEQPVLVLVAPVVPAALVGQPVQQELEPVSGLVLELAQPELLEQPVLVLVAPVVPAALVGQPVQQELEPVSGLVSD